MNLLRLEEIKQSSNLLLILFYKPLKLFTMLKLCSFQTLLFITLIGLFTVSCSENSELNPISDPGERIVTRSIVPDSVYQSHNDFILWAFDNYYDSLDYFASDPVDFIEFAERKRLIYSGGRYNISSQVINNDTLIFPSPHYVQGVGFTKTNGSYSSTWHTNLKLVLDSVLVAFDNEETESNILQIITRGKTRVNGISGLTNKDELLNVLTQAYYSVSLIYDIDDEVGTGNGDFVNGCALVGAMADVSALNYFNGQGDTDPDDPMYNFAMAAIAAVSLYSFTQCHCSNC